jgi:hypothetical protein
MLVYVVMIYNGLIVMRNDIDKSWGHLDALLPQRHGELPRQVHVCKGYMQYERETRQRPIEASLAARSRYAARTIDQKSPSQRNPVRYRWQRPCRGRVFLRVKSEGLVTGNSKAPHRTGKPNL